MRLLGDEVMSKNATLAQRSRKGSEMIVLRISSYTTIILLENERLCRQ